MDHKLNVFAPEFVPFRNNQETCNQRESLIKLMMENQLECSICYDRIEHRHGTWSCEKCYRILHLTCVNDWAQVSKEERGDWLCPGCLNAFSAVPDTYYCFCGKMRMEESWNDRSNVPHSCGMPCLQNLSKPEAFYSCPHSCNLLCHPGPCPPCNIQMTRSCGCGRKEFAVMCTTKIPAQCDAVCNKLLRCGAHYCEKPCHYGDCGPCVIVVDDKCECGKDAIQISCMMHRFGMRNRCGEDCDHILECGFHICDELCHPGECKPCALTPEALTVCCCGKTSTDRLPPRESCLDPLATCDLICGKSIPRCWPFDHHCKRKCHDDPCPPCNEKVKLSCACKNLKVKYSCSRARNNPIIRCEKLCNKKLHCGRHRCPYRCCNAFNHSCEKMCTRKLSCGKHLCHDTCHPGPCPSCKLINEEGVSCPCGKSSVKGPVPCWIVPPPCDNLCQRNHNCEHPVDHNCHVEKTCPPCCAFTEKWCFGHHEIRNTIPCFQKGFTCGKECGKLLPCGRHSCERYCHEDRCQPASSSKRCDKRCDKPCVNPRNTCGHPCLKRCHVGDCEERNCPADVTVTCPCGNVKSIRKCSSFNDTDAAQNGEMPLQRNLKVLACSESCAFIRRNEQLAKALQIKDPSTSPFNTMIPSYSSFMKGMAAKNPKFCEEIHKLIHTLVMRTKASSEYQLNYSMKVMNKEKRQFVHEYASHFGCSSESFDREPNRNVIVYAKKFECWVPSKSLLEVVKFQDGLRGKLKRKK